METNLEEWWRDVLDTPVPTPLYVQTIHYRTEHTVVNGALVTTWTQEMLSEAISQEIYDAVFGRGRGRTRTRATDRHDWSSDGF